MQLNASGEKIGEGVLQNGASEATFGFGNGECGKSEEGAAVSVVEVPLVMLRAIALALDEEDLDGARAALARAWPVGQSW